MKRKYRLTKNEDFQSVIQKRRGYTNKSFALYYIEGNGQENIRVGITTSKKLGKAHLRNKIRRQIRMMVQETFDLDLKMDVVIIARLGYLKLNYAQNLKELKFIYQKILKKKESK